MDSKFTISDSTKIHLYLNPIDMRKSFDSLIQLVKSVIKLDPFCGHLFIFTNKRQNMLKILFWDRTGFCIFYKRLENGKISLPNLGKPSTVIDKSCLFLLLDGISYN